MAATKELAAPAQRPAAKQPPTTRIGSRLWTSYHLYYPGNRDRVLTGFVKPLARRLLAEGRIDSFFFIRYVDEGGPHVRLRLRLLDERLAPLERRVREEAAGFFSRYPGAEALAELRASPQPGVAPGDPMPNPPGLRLDKLEGMPFEPEVERYGGAGVLAHSLDMFALSSSYALSFVESYGDHPRARRLSLEMCLLFWQACGFARGEDELLALLDYFSDWRERMSKVGATAEHAFEERGEAFRRLLASAAERFLESRPALASETPCTAAAVSEASRWLSTAIRGVSLKARHSIGTSQMHMTANRLGLTNAEETYVTRILSQAAAEAAAACAEPWARLKASLAERAACPAEAPGETPELPFRISLP